MKSAYIALGLATAMTAHADTLTVQVELASKSGALRAAIYENQQSFDAAKSINDVEVSAQHGPIRLTFNKVEPGTYGIAIFHDVNGNEKLDTNLFGAPTEPFGFSNNPKIGFSSPKFHEFKFEFNGEPMQLDVKLNGN